MGVPVPLNDLSRAVRDDQTLSEAMRRVLASGRYIQGDEVKAFEKEFAAFHNVSRAIGVANGTDAIELALRGLGIGPDKTVATVANAGFYSATAIRAIGAQAVYVDVDPESHLMDLPSLNALLQTRKIDAIVVTHLYGRLHAMNRITEIAQAAGASVVEDCAQAHGASARGTRAGAFGHVGCFSFYPTKNLGALGDGGAIITDDPDLADRIDRLRQYGWQRKYDVRLAGGRNSRLDELQAAVLRRKLPALDGSNNRRVDIARKYSAKISNRHVKCPHVADQEYVAHLYVIRVAEQRDSLMKHLSAQGIGCDIHYPIPDHLQAVNLGRAQGELPVTEDLAERVLTLPCFPELTEAEVQSVIDAVNSWVP